METTHKQEIKVAAGKKQNIYYRSFTCTSNTHITHWHAAIT